MALSDSFAEAAQSSPADMLRESLVAGDGFASFLQMEAAKTWTGLQDDAWASQSDQTIKRMLADPAVSAALSMLKASVIGDGIKVAVNPASPRDPRALRLAALARRDVRVSQFNTALWSVLDALAYGHSVSELLVRPAADAELGIAARLIAVKPKSRTQYQIVTDQAGNMVGVQRHDTPGAYDGSTTIDPANIIGNDRIMYLCPFPEASDPRGRSLVSRAWNPWMVKQNVWPSVYRYLKQFGSPSLIGTLGQSWSENRATTLSDGSTSDLDPADALLSRLEQFQAGSAMVVPDGTKIDVIQASPTEAMSSGLQMLNREIVMAVLMTARTILESQSFSKADSESALDVAEILVDYIRRTVELAAQSVFDRLADWTITDACDIELNPKISLRRIRSRDFPGTAMAIASGWGAGWLRDPSIVPTLDEMAGIEGRDYAAMQERLEHEDEIAVAAVQERGRMMNPLDDAEDDSENE